jgi:hypothetical protein
MSNFNGQDAPIPVAVPPDVADAGEVLRQKNEQWKRLIETDVFDNYPYENGVIKTLRDSITSDALSEDEKDAALDQYLLHVSRITRDTISKYMLDAYNFNNGKAILINDVQERIVELLNEEDISIVFNKFSDAAIELQNTFDVSSDTTRKNRYITLCSAFFGIAYFYYWYMMSESSKGVQADLMKYSDIGKYLGKLRLAKNISGILSMLPIILGSFTQISDMKVIRTKAISYAVDLVISICEYIVKYVVALKVTGVLGLTAAGSLFTFHIPVIACSLLIHLGIKSIFYYDPMYIGSGLTNITNSIKTTLVQSLRREYESLTLRSLKGEHDVALDVYKGLINTFGLSGSELEFGGQMTNIAYNNISVVKNYWLFYYFSDIYNTLDIDFSNLAPLKDISKEISDLKEQFRRLQKSDPDYTGVEKQISEKTGVLPELSIPIKASIVDTELYKYYLRDLNNRKVSNKHAYAIYLTLQDIIVRIYDLCKKSGDTVSNYSTNIKSHVKEGLKNLKTPDESLNSILTFTIETINYEKLYMLKNVYKYMLKYTVFNELDMYNDELQNGLTVDTNNQYIQLFKDQYTPELEASIFSDTYKLADSYTVTKEQLLDITRKGVLAIQDIMRAYNHGIFSANTELNPMKATLLPAFLKKFVENPEHKTLILGNLHKTFEEKTEVNQTILVELYSEQFKMQTELNLLNAQEAKLKSERKKPIRKDKDRKRKLIISLTHNKKAIENVLQGISPLNDVLDYVDVNEFRKVTYNPVYLYNLFGFYKDKENFINFFLKYLKNEIKESVGLNHEDYAALLEEYGFIIDKYPIPNTRDMVLRAIPHSNMTSIKTIKHLILLILLNYKNMYDVKQGIQYMPPIIFNTVDHKGKNPVYFTLTDVNGLNLPENMDKVLDAIVTFESTNPLKLKAKEWFYFSESTGVHSQWFTGAGTEYKTRKQNVYAMIQSFIGSNTAARAAHGKFSAVRYFFKNQFNFNPHAHAIFRFVNVLPTTILDTGTKLTTMLFESNSPEKHDAHIVKRFIQLAHNVIIGDGRDDTYADSGSPIKFGDNFTNSIINYTRYLEYDTKSVSAYMNSIYGNGVALQRASIIPTMNISLTFMKSMPWQQYINDKFWFYVDPNKRKVILSFQGTVEECHDSLANLGQGTPHFRVYRDNLTNIFDFLTKSKDPIIQANIMRMKKLWNVTTLKDAFHRYWWNAKHLLNVERANTSATQSLSSIFYSPTIVAKNTHYPYKNDLTVVLDAIKTKVFAQDPNAFTGFDYMNSKVFLTRDAGGDIKVEFKDFGLVDNAVVGKFSKIITDILKPSVMDEYHIPKPVVFTERDGDAYKILDVVTETPGEYIGCTDQFGFMAHSVFELLVLGVFDKQKFSDYIKLHVKEPGKFTKKLYLSNVLEATQKMLKTVSDTPEPNDVKFFATGHSMGGGTISSFYWLLFYYFILSEDDIKLELIEIIRKTICHAYAPPRAFTMKCSILIDFLRCILLENKYEVTPQEKTDSETALEEARRDLAAKKAALEAVKVSPEVRNDVAIGTLGAVSAATAAVLVAPNNKILAAEGLAGAAASAAIAGRDVILHLQRVKAANKELSKAEQTVKLAEQIYARTHDEISGYPGIITEETSPTSFFTTEKEFKELQNNMLYKNSYFSHDVHFLCISNPYDPIGKVMNSMYHAGNVVLIHEQFLNYAKYLYRQKYKGTEKCDAEFNFTDTMFTKFAVKASQQLELLTVTMNGIQTLYYDKILSDQNWGKVLEDVITWGSGGANIEDHDILQSYNLLDEDTSNTAGGIHNIFSYVTNFKKYEYALELLNNVERIPKIPVLQQLEPLVQAGGEAQTVVLASDPRNAIESVRERIQRREGRPSDQKPLIFQGLPPDQLQRNQLENGDEVTQTDLSTTIANFNILMSELVSENITTEINEEGYNILNILTMLNNENAYAFNNGDMSFQELSMIRNGPESIAENSLSPINLEIQRNQKEYNNIHEEHNALMSKNRSGTLSQEERIRMLDLRTQIRPKLDALTAKKTRRNANKASANIPHAPRLFANTRKRRR